MIHFHARITVIRFQRTSSIVGIEHGQACITFSKIIEVNSQVAIKNNRGWTHIGSTIVSIVYIFKRSAIISKSCVCAGVAIPFELIVSVEGVIRSRAGHTVFSKSVASESGVQFFIGRGGRESKLTPNGCQKVGASIVKYAGEVVFFLKREGRGARMCEKITFDAYCTVTIF